MASAQPSMPDPLGAIRGGKRDKYQTTDSILNVTYQLLEASGYSAVTTDQIAAQARVSKATIYKIWGTKQELVVDAARKHFGVVDSPDLGSFRAEVHWILENRMRDYRDEKTLRLIGEMIGASVADPQLMGLFTEWVSRLSESIRATVERGIRRGDISEHIDVFALENLIAGVIARTVVVQRSFSADELSSIVALITAAAACSTDESRH